MIQMQITTLSRSHTLESSQYSVHTTSNWNIHHIYI